MRRVSFGLCGQLMLDVFLFKSVVMPSIGRVAPIGMGLSDKLFTF
jgi:hypothetical protein